MKNFLLLLLSIIPLFSQAQKTPRTVTFDGVSRSYIEYVPTIYDGSTAVPLVIALHGLGDTDDNFSNVGFEVLSEVENFIVVTPQALFAEVEVIPGVPIPVGNAWNSGAGYSGITLNPDVKDVEFISFLIDSFVNHYNIDLDRVYATGFSMGGFMSNRLACELNDKIAAIGSVAGTIGSALNCNPERAVPMIHFHGTDDGTVAYTNNTFGTDAEETVEFWATNNSCDASSSATAFPDNVSDGITLTHYVYNNCDADVEFFKADGAGHDWLYKPNNDISYTIEIWDFFSRQSLGNACENVSVDLGSDVGLDEGESVVLDATTQDATYLWSTGEVTSTITVTSSGTYSVTITIDGCTATDDITVDFVTGVFNSKNSFDFQIYPNPITNKGAIALESTKNSNVEVLIYNLLGEQVYVNQQQVVSGDNQIEFDVQNIASGSYLLSLRIDGNESNKQIIIQ